MRSGVLLCSLATMRSRLPPSTLWIATSPPCQTKKLNITSGTRGLTESQFQSEEWEVREGLERSCLWCYLISEARERASRSTPDAHHQPLMTSQEDWVPQMLHRSQTPPLQSTVFLSGSNQSAAQFGWWQACSVRGEVGPGWFPPSLLASPRGWHPSPPQPSSKCASVLPFPPTAAPHLLPQHYYTPSFPLILKHPAITQLLTLSQEPVLLHPPTLPATLLSFASWHPSIPPTPISPQEHSSVTNHMGFHKSFKVCCLWEPLVFMQRFSIRGNTWLGR